LLYIAYYCYVLIDKEVLLLGILV